MKTPFTPAKKQLAHLFCSTLALSLLLSLITSYSFAQASIESVPASSNVRGATYPRITTDLRGIFQIKAPKAEKVQIQIGKTYDMKRDTSGTWSVTTEPLEPGFHYYSLVVNGVTVADPASESFYGMGRMASGIEIPEKGADFYQIKNVPHGDVRLQTYFSTLTNTWRQLNIYTPPGYDGGNTKYPILYIQHGNGEDERGWIVQGKANYILDNLIAQKKANPMIIVVANGNVSTAGGYSDEVMNAFKTEMIGNIIPFVEQKYRVLPGKENRAIAGLSMGGGQSFYTGLRNTDVFGSVGMFSSGIFGSTPAATFDAEKQIPGLLTKTDQFNKNLKLFYVSVGEQDPRFEPSKKMISQFKEKNLKVTFNSFPGGHEWQVWRKSLNDFAPLLFR